MKPKKDNDKKSGNSNFRKQQSIIQRHEERVESFKNKNQRLNVLDNKIKVATKELDKLNKETSFKKLNHEDIEDELLFKVIDKEAEIKRYRDERESIESGQEETDYLLNSYDLILKYTMLDEQEKELLVKSNPSNDEIAELNRISNEKHNVIDDYLTKFEKGYSSTKTIYHTELSLCLTCNEPLEFSDGFYVCSICGLCKDGIADDIPNLSYKERQNYDYRPQFTYDKQSHLEDWIRRFQAKENRVIPQEVLDKVVLEAKKERIRDLNLLTEEKVKRYLKKLGLNEYYDNVIGIINRINGRDPFTLTVEVEEKIKTMFQQIQAPYEKHKPKNRKNFLSYSYTLHKFFQILGLHEFCKYFPLLKSAEKLRQQDEIFKKVVAEMAEKDKTINWVFYPSI